MELSQNDGSGKTWGPLPSQVAIAAWSAGSGIHNIYVDAFRAAGRAVGFFGGMASIHKAADKVLRVMVELEDSYISPRTAEIVRDSRGEVLRWSTSVNVNLDLWMVRTEDSFDFFIRLEGDHHDCRAAVDAMDAIILNRL